MVDLMDEAACRACALGEDVVIACADVVHFFFGYGRIVERGTPVWAALENLQLGDLVSNRRNDLHAACACPNDADAFAFKRDGVFWPMMGMKALAFKCVHTGKAWLGRHRQDTKARNDKARCVGFP